MRASDGRGAKVYADGKLLGEVLSADWKVDVERVQVPIPRGREQAMQDETVIAAPRNPYRREEVRRGEMTLGNAWGSAPPPRYDTERGPGLTAADIDHIARQHHRAGYAAAEREAEKRVEAMQRELMEAYDRGYTEGRVERARGLARDIRGKLLGIHFALLAVEQGAKSKAHERLASVRAQWDDVNEFVCGIETSSGKAARQVARDES